jgi:hypothetical protein
MLASQLVCFAGLSQKYPRSQGAEIMIQKK